MKIRIVDDSSFSKDIRKILDVPVASLHGLFQRIETVTAPLVAREDFDQIVKSEFSDDVTSSAMANFIMQFAGVVRHSGASTNDVYDSIHQYLSTADQNQAAEFEQRWDVLKSILQSNTVKRVEKAFHLAYEHSYILHDVEIFTDLRPVFNDSKDKIEGGVIVQTLHIETVNNGRASLQSIVLDKDDIRKLKTLISDAEKKSKKLEQMLESNCDIKVYVP